MTRRSLSIVTAMTTADPILALCIARELERQGTETKETQEAAIEEIKARKPKEGAPNE